MKTQDFKVNMETTQRLQRHKMNLKSVEKGERFLSWVLRWWLGRETKAKNKEGEIIVQMFIGYEDWEQE